MNLSSAVHSIRLTVRNHGSMPAMYDFAMRALNKCIYYKSLQFVISDKVNEKCLALPAHFRFSRLSERDLLGLARFPENELTTDFLQVALRKGDECYAIFEGDVLASYGWYSRQPTLVENNELLLTFDSRYIYMYKGFTLERYRGQRLHGIGKTLALAKYQSQGFDGIVFCVESNNYNSLKSSHRMGCRNCGRIRIARIGGKYTIQAQPECQRYGLAIQWTAGGTDSAAQSSRTHSRT